MNAMVLSRLQSIDEHTRALERASLPEPIPASREILVRVSACGVCHTELDEIEGRMPPARLPMVLGHQVIGRVEQTGANATRFKRGDRVGIAWIFSACGECKFCRTGAENLCADFRATGRDAPGGYAEYITVAEDFAHTVPDIFSDAQAAPLLCAGAIGYRSLKLTGLRDGQTLGLMGFGASAHLVLQLARFQLPNSPVLVFSRSETERAFARELGAAWAGNIDHAPPATVDALIDTTPAWKPIVDGLAHLERGGRLVVNAIRKESADQADLLRLDYPKHLWLEKEIKSVANVTRADVREFLEIAARIPIKPAVQEFELTDANQALRELKLRKIRGAKVLRIR